MANKANACQFRAIGIGLLITALLWPAVVRPAVLFNPAGVSGQRFAAALSEVGDQNGDGRWELLSGSYMYSVGGAERGRLYLWFGGNSLALSADWTYEGQPAEWLGFAVARIGDVNNDGTDDFAAGAPLANNAGAEAGRVYIFFGGTPLPSSPDVILEGPTAGGHFGFSVSAAGDFNRDGRDDLIVGAPNYSLSGTERGAAYIYYGGSSIGSDPDLTVIGEIAGDHFGWSVTDCGNFTGTVENCVAVGAPHHTSAGLDAGAAYVFEGGSSPNTTPEHKFTNIGTAPLSEYGFVVRGLGRWDGDSYDDLAVAAPYDNTNGSDAGRVEVFYGGTGAGPTCDRFVNGDYGGNGFGYSLGDAMHLTGDSRPDLLIGAPFHGGDATNGGRAYIFRGGSSSVSDAGNLPDIINVEGVMPGTEANDLFGFAVTGCGDFDGDGDWDFAIGAPDGNINNNATAGYVHIYDSSGGLVSTGISGWQATWTQHNDVVLRFGLAEARTAVAEFHLGRELLVAAAGPVLDAATVYSGPVPGSDGPVTVTAGSGGRWQVLDGGATAALAAAGANRVECIAYRLTLTLNDGRRLDLGRLAGPSLLRPAVGPELRAPWPNPFNPSTSVSFRAPADRPVVCAVYDPRGRLVTTLFTGTASGAWQTVNWNGRSGDQAAAAGLYLVRLSVDERSLTRRIMLTK